MWPIFSSISCRQTLESRLLTNSIDIFMWLLVKPLIPSYSVAMHDSISYVKGCIIMIFLWLTMVAHLPLPRYADVLLVVGTLIHLPSVTDGFFGVCGIFRDFKALSKNDVIVLKVLIKIKQRERNK